MAGYIFPFSKLILNPRISLPEQVQDRVRLASPEVPPPDRLLTFTWFGDTAAPSFSRTGLGPGDYGVLATPSHDLTDDYVYRLVDARVFISRHCSGNVAQTRRLIGPGILRSLIPQGQNQDQVERMGVTNVIFGPTSANNFTFYYAVLSPEARDHLPNLSRGSVLAPSASFPIAPDGTIGAAAGNSALGYVAAEVKYVGWPSTERNSGALWLPELYR